MTAPENTMTISTCGLLKHQAMTALRFVVILATFASSLLAETCCGGSGGSGGSGSGGSSSGGCAPEQYIRVYPASGSTLCPGDVVDVYLEGCSCSSGSSVSMTAHFRAVPGSGSITPESNDSRHWQFKVPEPDDINGVPGPWEVEAYASGGWSCSPQPTFPNSKFYASFTVGGPTAGPAPTGTITVVPGVECQGVVLVEPGLTTTITIAPTDVDKTCKNNDLQDTFTKEHALKWESDGGGEFIPEEGTTVLFVPPVGDLCKIKITSKGNDDATAAGTVDDTATGDAHVELASKTIQYFALDGISINRAGTFPLENHEVVTATLAVRGCKDGLTFTYELVEISDDADDVVQSVEATALQHPFTITEAGRYIIRVRLCDAKFDSQQFVRYTLTVTPDTYEIVWDEHIIQGLEDAKRELDSWAESVSKTNMLKEGIESVGKLVEEQNVKILKEVDEAIAVGEQQKLDARDDYQAAENQRAEQEAKVKDLEARKVAQEAAAKELEENLKVRGQLLADRQARLKELERLGNGNSNEAQRLRTSITRLQKELQGKASRLATINKAIQELLPKIEEAAGKLQTLTAKVARLAERLTHLTEQVAEFIKRRKEFVDAFAMQGRSAAKIPVISTAARRLITLGKKFLPWAAFAYDTSKIVEFATKTDAISDEIVVMKDRAELYRKAIDALSSRGVRQLEEPPYSLEVTVTSKPGAIDFEFFESPPVWFTKESQIGPFTNVDGDFTHLATIDFEYRWWQTPLTTSAGREGEWQGTFDFHGNLGNSTATLRGITSDGARIAVKNVKLASAGMTEQEALKLAELKQEEIKTKSKETKRIYELVEASVSAAFFLAGLAVAWATASIATGGLVALLGIAAVAIVWFFEWLFTSSETDLDRNIKYNFPLGV